MPDIFGAMRPALRGWGFAALCLALILPQAAAPRLPDETTAGCCGMACCKRAGACHCHHSGSAGQRRAGLNAAVGCGSDCARLAIAASDGTPSLPAIEPSAEPELPHQQKQVEVSAVRIARGSAWELFERPPPLS